MDKTKSLSITSTINCKTNELLDAMKFLGRVVPRNKKGKLYNCEVTVKTNEVILVVIGATRVLYCESSGPVKMTIPFFYLNEIIKNTKTFSTQISIREGLIQIGNLTVNVKTCFFKDDTILRSINLPINYSISDLLHLSDNYTQEEIEFNKLNLLLKTFYADMENDINLAFSFLSKYGVTKDEVKNIVQNRLSYIQHKSNQL